MENAVEFGKIEDRSYFEYIQGIVKDIFDEKDSGGYSQQLGDKVVYYSSILFEYWQRIYDDLVVRCGYGNTYTSNTDEQNLQFFFDRDKYMEAKVEIDNFKLGESTEITIDPYAFYPRYYRRDLVITSSKKDKEDEMDLNVSITLRQGKIISVESSSYTYTGEKNLPYYSVSEQRSINLEFRTLGS